MPWVKVFKNDDHDIGLKRRKYDHFDDWTKRIIPIDLSKDSEEWSITDNQWSKHTLARYFASAKFYEWTNKVSSQEVSAIKAYTTSSGHISSFLRTQEGNEIVDIYKFNAAIFESFLKKYKDINHWTYLNLSMREKERLLNQYKRKISSELLLNFADEAKTNINHITSALEKSPLDQDLIVYRRTNGEIFSKLFNEDFDNLYDDVQNSLLNRDKVNRIIENISQSSGGFKEHSFLSTSISKDPRFSNSGAPILFRILAPKGTKAAYMGSSNLSKMHFPEAEYHYSYDDFIDITKEQKENKIKNQDEQTDNEILINRGYELKYVDHPVIVTENGREYLRMNLKIEIPDQAEIMEIN